MKTLRAVLSLLLFGCFACENRIELPEAAQVEVIEYDECSCQHGCFGLYFNPWGGEIQYGYHECRGTQRCRVEKTTYKYYLANRPDDIREGVRERVLETLSECQ